MTSSWPCLRPNGPGAVLDVHVVPNARQTACAGLQGGALRVRLAAPPVDGAANEALLRWLADELGVPRRHVQLAHGASSRRKQVRLDVDPVQVADWLARHAHAA